MPQAIGIYNFPNIIYLYIYIYICQGTSVSIVNGLDSSATTQLKSTSHSLNVSVAMSSFVVTGDHPTAGTYEQTGQNHSKPVFKKSEPYQGLDTYCYYWEHKVSIMGSLFC